MATAAPQLPRPGRPSSGARERILDAAIEVLKSDGYAGLSLAKVAARADENKALISYHFGSRQGLVAAAARELGETISRDVLRGLEGVRTVDEVVGGAFDSLWQLLERDARLARVYIDLNAVSVVEDDVRTAIREIKASWRAELTRLLRGAGVSSRRAGTGADLLIAASEGFSLDWLERGDTPELRSARTMFVRAISAQLAA